MGLVQLNAVDIAALTVKLVKVNTVASRVMVAAQNKSRRLNSAGLA